MQSRFKIQRGEKAALRADDLKSPSAPALTAPAMGVPQFINGVSRLGRSHLHIDDFKTRVVQDRFLITDKVKKAAHWQFSCIRDTHTDW
jgi:hypothetical protein